MTRRRYVLGGLTVLFGLLAVAILWEVVGTVFFALTVAYVLAPVRRRLAGVGASRRVAAGVATAAGFLGTVVVFSPLLFVLIVRLESVVDALERAPETVTLELWGFSHTVVTADAAAEVTAALVATAASVASAAPVLLIKLMLFVFVVYSLLYSERSLRRAGLALVPPGYRDIAGALHTRARRTLYGIYVVQVATGIATFLVALPVFLAFGYPSAIALATAAGVLQFIPVLGPSLLILALAVSHLLAGDVVAAIAIFLVGGFLVGWVPDLVVRPWLAAETAKLPASLYFIGFTGGVLTIGAIGVIVGPLAVALVAELSSQLSDEFNRIRVREEPD
ncbi:AI-2E family transporter [Haloparvum sedimenti]|uniref:AI-2E family transporter n=1 Tax=Haloparvum sedimenti TaxID=1678448 RepID=UPI00071E791F|nr:AI-2E family transporter [Haloparvum sedimenti]